MGRRPFTDTSHYTTPGHIPAHQHPHFEPLRANRGGGSRLGLFVSAGLQRGVRHGHACGGSIGPRPLMGGQGTPSPHGGRHRSLGSGRGARVSAVSRATVVRGRRATYTWPDERWDRYTYPYGGSRAREARERLWRMTHAACRRAWVYFRLIYIRGLGSRHAIGERSSLDMRYIRGRMRSVGQRRRCTCSHALGGARRVEKV